MPEIMWLGVRERWPDGTRVVKCGSAPDDVHGDGARGTVRGVMCLVGDKGEFVGCYVVEWDDMPGLMIHVAPPRLRRLDSA